MGGELPPRTRTGALKNLVLHQLGDVAGAAKVLAPLPAEFKRKLQQVLVTPRRPVKSP